MGSWRTRAVPAESVRELAHRLTDRDRLIVADLARFKLFTLEQLERLYFDSYSSARDRIATLTEMGVLQRFRPHTRAAYQYLLGWHGLRIDHAGRVEDYERNPNGIFLGEKKPKPGRVPSKAFAEIYADRIIASAHRRHLEGVNDCYSRVAAACRVDASIDLVRWYTEAEAYDMGPLYGMRADGAFQLDLPRGAWMFCVEFDTGTEPLTRLVTKARHFNEQAARLASADRERSIGGVTSWYMLIELTKTGREDNFHQRIAEIGQRLPVATTLVERAADPLGPVWRLAGAPAGALFRLDRFPILH